MENNYRQPDADQFKDDLGQCIYVSRLIGKNPDLVLHGGGNTSVKTSAADVFGKQRPIIYVKASGYDLSDITAEGFSALDLNCMQRLRGVASLSQEEMIRQMRLCLLNPDSPNPSLEAFLHAFIPSKYIVHTHPSALLALTNQRDPRPVIQQLFGADVVPVRYITAGFGLAQESAAAFGQSKTAKALVLMQHGLVTWGDTAEQAYAETVRIVSKAESYWQDKNRTAGTMAAHMVDVKGAWEKYTRIAPILRGLLAEPTGDQDQPFRKSVLVPWISSDAIDFLNHPSAKKLALTAPLTPDHLVRTKSFPMLIENPHYDHPEEFKKQLRFAIEAYSADYNSYFQRHAHRLEGNARRLDSLPRVVLLPGIGAVCSGVHEKAAIVSRDITAQSLTVKQWFALSGAEYVGIDEEHLFDMEYLLMQQAKIKVQSVPLQSSVAIVTGAAGAIGMGITEALLQNGCHVSITDLAGESLDRTSAAFSGKYPHQVHSCAMDVTDSNSVKAGFEDVIRRWGGVDLVIVNAGVAMVSSLIDMDIEAFRRIERVNVEGTLLVLKEAANAFLTQALGGDVVMISTKNVFAPGAKFGAYSATKAGAHQLARIASLEFAEMDVRVNMVAPDAVFSHGQTKSGLWAEVGPDRMKARGLDEAGLEEYYRNRNLLKARITAEHVARAVLFFATRQTPTTGATLPVDGGLPDATPR